jgi:uncharacterized membrane protein HdeD (DUF308 family)
VETFFNNLYYSVQDLPGLLAVLAYLLGLTCIITGSVMLFRILKKKSHKKIKCALFLMFFSGALFSLPIMFERMYGDPPIGECFVMLFLFFAIVSLLPQKPKRQDNEN